MPATIVVTTQDGQEIRGVRRNEDTFSLQMMDESGRLRLFDKLKLADIHLENVSLMPGDFATPLTSTEIDDLVAYLTTLQQRNPSRASTVSTADGVSYERLVKASEEPHNWLMYWGDYQGTHYSRLKQIDAWNVRQLQAVWAMPLPGDSTLDSTPLVVDGIMYVTSSGNPATVTALDARTGRQLWRWTRRQPLQNPYEINRFNRGVAVLGHRIFVGTLDAALIALDARNGLPLWKVQVGDTMDGYSITSPPLAIRDKIVVGISGDTWKGDGWRHGGAAPWLTGSYDPEHNLAYWSTGNPAPHTDRTSRGDGDNLFSCAVLALDADTGRRVWHYQFTPNDGHDWDSAEDMILVDRLWHGQPRKLLIHADRNGLLYVLDRTDGRFLQATPFVHQTWNAGFDVGGRPLTVPGWNSSAKGSILVYPTLGGGTNFQAPSYSVATGLLYLEYGEGGAQFASRPAVYERGRQYSGRVPGSEPPPQRGPNDPPPTAGIKALDPESGQTVWDFKIFRGSLSAGVLATAGNVLLAAIRDGNLAALDAKTGEPLWHVQTGAALAASPMSYAVGGRQFVAIAAGNTLYGFALPEWP